MSISAELTWLYERPNTGFIGPINTLQQHRALSHSEER